LVLGLFENFENRLAGLNRVLSHFSALAEQADPKFGFRPSKTWVTQVWPNGPDGTQIWVPPVYSQGAASCLQNFYFSFQHFNIQTPKSNPFS
jgi:hypothetical protein